MHWLFHNLAWDIWAYLAGLVIAAFVVGVSAGQLRLVQEFIGKQPLPPQTIEGRPLSDPYVEQLTNTYNERVATLQKGIVDEEKSSWTLEGSYHREAADRLRRDLMQANNEYKSALAELRATREPNRKKIR